MIYILIPIYNRLDYTLACLKSLSNQTYKEFQTIVIDDGSTDGSSTEIQNQFPDVIVLKGNGTLWWTGSINLGLKKALDLSFNLNDFVLLLNNDLITKSNYLQEMINLANKEANSIIGSISVDIKTHEIHYLGTQWNSKLASSRPAMKGQFNLSEIQSKHDFIKSSHLPGRGTLIPVQCFKFIGFLNSTDFPHYAADYDLSLRAKRLGYRLIVSTHAVVYSYTTETGINNKEALKLYSFFKTSYTSIKSPLNIYTRWRFAKRHATSPPFLYFLLDFCRITYSLIKSRLFFFNSRI